MVLCDLVQKLLPCITLLIGNDYGHLVRLPGEAVVNTQTQQNECRHTVDSVVHSNLLASTNAQGSGMNVTPLCNEVRRNVNRPHVTV